MFLVITIMKDYHFDTLPLPIPWGMYSSRYQADYDKFPRFDNQ